MKSLLKVGLSTGLAILASISLVAVALAEESSQPGKTESFLKQYQEPTVSNQLDIPWWSFSIDLILKLVLIVGLIYVSIFILRQFTGGGRSRLILPQSSINVVDSSHLAPNRSIYLVEIGDRVLVVGATTAQLQTLAEFTDPAVVQQIKEGKDNAPGFSEHLKLFGDRLLGSQGRSSEPQMDAEGQMTQPAESVTSGHQTISELRRLAQRFAKVGRDETN